MSKSDKPIIRSRLDLDLYKLTMGRWIWETHPDVLVTFGTINRSKKIRLLNILDPGQIREELEHVRTLFANQAEKAYLRGLGFPKDYVDFFGDMVFPKFELRTETDSGQRDLELSFPGAWAKSTYWETFALAILTELRFRWMKQNLRPLDLKAFLSSRWINLQRKKDLLQSSPLTYTEFGTRRRASFEWQVELNYHMARELPAQHAATSNVKIAMMLGLEPRGTNAHECQQTLAGLAGANDEELRYSVERFLREWVKMYEGKNTIILSDTYGTDFVLANVDPTLLESCKGFRHDSGDPFEFARKILKWYQSRGIKTKEKLILFSVSLTAEIMLQLWNEFHEDINVTFGWGTNLTFDYDGLKPISLVCKVIEVDGRPAVKLSDNLAKAVGPIEEVERYKRVFGYSNEYSEECRT